MIVFEVDCGQLLYFNLALVRCNQVFMSQDMLILIYRRDVLFSQNHNAPPMPAYFGIITRINFIKPSCSSKFDLFPSVWKFPLLSLLQPPELQ